MLIDGEKYACDACIRGHRVSSCQHNGMRSYTTLFPPLRDGHWLCACGKGTSHFTILSWDFADRDHCWIERPLSHINRKGRPVSQCPHCRGLRKARANHVKCECGTKPHSKTDCKKETNDSECSAAEVIWVHADMFCKAMPQRTSNAAVRMEAVAYAREREIPIWLPFRRLDLRPASVLFRLR